MNDDKRRQRAKAKAKEKRRSAQGKAKPPPGRPAADPDFKYDSPESLQSIGPIIEAKCSIPASMAAKLLKAGRPVPAPVTGFLLIDTGARSTCIADDVAKELGLFQVGNANTYGAGGLHSNPVYAACLEMMVSTAGGKTMSVKLESSLLGIPDLNKHIMSMGVQVDGGSQTKQVRLIGLLGRDFLRHARFTYDGDDGLIRIVVVDGSMPESGP